MLSFLGGPAESAETIGVYSTWLVFQDVAGGIRARLEPFICWLEPATGSAPATEPSAEPLVRPGGRVRPVIRTARVFGHITAMMRSAQRRASGPAPWTIELDSVSCQGSPIQCSPGTGDAPRSWTGLPAASRAPGT